MKKIIITLVVVIVVFFLGIALVPILFKDKIKASVDEAIAKKVKATVYYNTDRFDLSVFSNFPNITLTLADFGVVGKDHFAGDTLVSVGEFKVVADIMSVIKGGTIKVIEISLLKPRIHAIRLPDGSANWDITIPDTTQKVAEPETKSSFSVKISRWKITGGDIFVSDALSPAFVALRNLNHVGSGDFTQDLVDLKTKTDIELVTIDYDSVAYIVNKKFTAVLNMDLNLPESQYKFKDNSIKLNEFAIAFAGSVAMKGNDIISDVTFKSTDNSIKGLLSLVPGVYKKGFEDIKTDGNFSFDGFGKGTYNPTTMPSFGLNLKVDKGMLQYPKLPVAITNINLDMAVSNPGGSLENTLTDIRKFHLDLGKNPVDARLKVKGLKVYDLDAAVKASVNLAEITQAFPVEGTTLKGLFSVDANAKGVYNAAEKQMPSVQATSSLVDGYVKTSTFPEPLEQVNFSISAQNPTGQLKDTKVNVENFNMLLEGEPLKMSAYIENFEDYTYDVKIDGAIDLAKITKIYPVEGSTVAGLLKANIATKGKMSYVTAKKYNQLPTSGTLTVSGFTYKKADLPAEIKVDNAAMNFDPQAMQITAFKGFLGKSDVEMHGKVSNYIGYVLNNETIKGNLSLTSATFDVNEWMSKEPAKTDPNAETPMSVVAVPGNIDFVFSSKMDKVLYTNMELTNLKGSIIVKDGTVKMDHLFFNTLDGSITMNGLYDPRNLRSPLYNYDLDLRAVNVKKAYETFNTIKTLAPAAKNVDGSFNMLFKVSGNLNTQMMPDYPTMNGAGTISLLNASINNLDFINGLNKITKLNTPNTFSLKDVVIKSKIENGRVNFDPFNLGTGTTQMTISGSQGFDKTIDYLVKATVPSGAAGAAVNSLISQYTGQNNTIGTNVKMRIKVTGTTDSPKYSLDGVETGSGGGSTGGNALDAAKKSAQAEIDKAKADATAKANAALDAAKQQAEQAKQAAEAKLKADQEAAKKQAADKAKEELEKAKKRFGF